MALSWANKRQLSYFLIVFLVVVVPLSILIVVNRYQEPTCFDEEQNQGEEGVDCGGPCSIVCAEGNDNLVVEWDRSLQVTNSSYNIVALVENKHETAGIKEVQYTFRMYDNKNALVEKRTGTTYVNPGERFFVFEPRVNTGYRMPVRTFLEFETSPVWTETNKELPGIKVKERSIDGLNSNPRLTATLENPSLVPVRNIDVVAVVYGVDGNALGASATYMKKFARTSERKVYFTWPEPFEGKVSRIEVIPRVNIFTWEPPFGE